MEAGAVGRGLPLPVLAAATGVLAVLLLVGMMQMRSRAGRFLLFAVWARYILSAYHTFTFQKVAAGLSGNALGSLGVLGLGLLILDKRLFLQKFFIPFYVMMGVIFVSAAVNGTLGGAITVLTKYGYLLVVAVAMFEALARAGERQVLQPLLWAFSPLLLLQALSVALGVAKATEADGSTSYIGGFDHEATFSVGLATCLLVACFAAKGRPWLRFGAIFAAVAGIVLANYRTTILAIAPLLFAAFALPELRKLHEEHKHLVRFGAVFLVIVLGVAGGFVLQERFHALVTSFQQFDLVFRSPLDFGWEQRRLLSGRLHIWAYYIDGYRQGGPVQHVFGFGPESWVPVMDNYAHNTLASHLYEYGWVGVAATLLLWGSMLVAAAASPGPQRPMLVAAHAGFLLLNMATMPHWQIEGNIFYGLLCGYTLYIRRISQVSRASPAATAGRDARAPAPA